MRTAPKAPDLLERMCEDDGTAKAAVFLQLCREWPELREWLWRDFASNSKVRDNFAKVLDEGPQLAVGKQWIAEFSGEADVWRAQREELISKLGSTVLRAYGGKTYAEMIKLIRQYQAGALDLGTFLLAREWLNAKGDAKKSIRLMRSASEFVDAVVSGNGHLLDHLEQSLRILALYQNSFTRRKALGHVKWWRLQLLIYMLRNPRPYYPMRELLAHLTTLGLRVRLEDVRSFCVLHEIKRDTRAGRPARKRTFKEDL